MSKIQQGYEWLLNEPGPKMILEALKLFGTKEIAGKQHNPVILGWANEVGLGLDKIYSSDEVPWCGLFMAVVAKRAGKEIPKGPAWAKSWGNFGIKVTSPMLGDIITFNRPGGGGHVGLYVGEDPGAYHILGGNQGNAVTIARISKDRKYSINRPVYTRQPENVRKIQLKATGKLSQNEA